MKVRFLGATKTVTGSRYLVTHGKTKVLVDCGLFQGFKYLRLRNWAAFPIPLSEMDAILLTHAHLDHSGYIPLLTKNGFRGVVYATPATIDLCRILLPDSGHLQEEEARYANKRGYSKHKPALPLYTVEDARQSLSLLRPVDWRTPCAVSNGGLGTIEFQFHPAGHLLGAASVSVRADGSSIAFSGDIGRKNDPIICEPDPQFGVSDLVVESTYGDRAHPKKDSLSQLREIILRTYARKGTVLIPSFAVGRTQHLLYCILQLKRANQIPDVPVYLNSPMASEANRAYLRHAGELKLELGEMQEALKNVRTVGSPEESKALNEQDDPAIILAASGMATGGRVLHHLKKIAPDPKNAILFVGFQSGGTRGDLIVHGADKIKIHGEFWPIRAEVDSIETLSAHADSDEILAWIRSLKRKPKRVFVTHGEPSAAEGLRQRISTELDVEAVVPDYEQEFEGS